MIKLILLLAILCGHRPALQADPPLQLYVANFRAPTISVLDPDSGQLVNTMDLGTVHPYELAFTPDGSRCYITGLFVPAIWELDLVSGQIINTIVTGDAPGRIVISGNLAFVGHPSFPDGRVSIINTNTNQILQVLHIGNVVDGLAVAGGSVYAACSDSDWVTAIDTTTFAVLSIPVGHQPEGLVSSPDGAFVYCCNAGDNSISVIDVAQQRIDHNIQVPNPTVCAVSPDGAHLYVSQANGDASLAIVDLATRQVVSEIYIAHQVACFDIFVTPDGHFVYLGGAWGSPVLYQVDVTNGSVRALTGFQEPSGMAIR